MHDERHSLKTQLAMRVQFVLVFVLGGAIVAGTVYQVRHVPYLDFSQVLSWQYVFLVLLLVGSAISIIRKIATRFFWEVLLTITLFLGTWYLCLLVLPIGWALLIAALLTLSHLFFRNVLLHDIFYLLGAAGVAIDFAGWLSPELLLVGLTLTAIYDVLAGPPEGTIGQLAQKLIKQGLVPGVVIADRFRDLFTTIDQAMKRHSAMLGAGDLILPLALVARAAFVGVWQAGLVTLGTVISAVALARGEMSHPRMMLPALALGAALPFIVLRLLGQI